MKTVVEFITEIQDTYGTVPAGVMDGPCDLCGYDTSRVNNCTLTRIPYDGSKVLSVCSYCRTATEKQWIGEKLADGSLAGRIHGMLVPPEKLLSHLPDYKVAELLTARLLKRLTGYPSQRQMVPS